MEPIGYIFSSWPQVFQVGFTIFLMIPSDKWNGSIVFNLAPTVKIPEGALLLYVFCISVLALLSKRSVEVQYNYTDQPGMYLMNKWCLREVSEAINLHFPAQKWTKYIGIKSSLRVANYYYTIN